jgi:hypothetical protein
VAEGDGGEEVEGVVGEEAALGLVVGEEDGLRLCVGRGVRCQLRKSLQGPWISKYSFACLVAS